MDKLLARQRRRLSSRGLQPKTQTLINKLRAAKKAAPPGEKPAVIKTHLRNMVILPEMIGSVVGVYNGKVFNVVEIKPDMVGYYLGEFSITYKPIRHGRPGESPGSSLFFVPLLICLVQVLVPPTRADSCRSSKRE